MKKGFTLIELLAVIVIIAIISTIGMYSITKLLNNSRIKSLNNTAFAVRKAAKLYAANNEVPKEGVVLDFTPGNGLSDTDPNYISRGESATLIELNKDPYGDDYLEVKAEITPGSKRYSIYVILKLKTKTFALEDDAPNIEEAIFKATSLTASSPIIVNNDAIVKYKVLNAFDHDDVVVKIYKGNLETEAAFNTDYNDVRKILTKDENDNYQVQIKFLKTGIYYIKITIKNGSNIGEVSEPITVAVDNVPPPKFASIVVNPIVTAWGGWMDGWEQTLNNLVFSVAPTPSSITLTVQCLHQSGDWFNLVSNKTISHSTNYRVESSSISAIKFTYDGAGMSASNGLCFYNSVQNGDDNASWDWFYYKLRLIIEDDINPPVVSDVYEFINKYDSWY